VREEELAVLRLEPFLIVKLPFTKYVPGPNVKPIMLRYYDLFTISSKKSEESIEPELITTVPLVQV